MKICFTYFGDNITVHLNVFVKTEKEQTLRLEAKLMIERWRSLFLCAGVNSGREAALSAGARNRMRKNSHSNVSVCKCHFAAGQRVTHNPRTTYYFEVLCYTQTHRWVWSCLSSQRTKSGGSRAPVSLAALLPWWQDSYPWRQQLWQLHYTALWK